MPIESFVYDINIQIHIEKLKKAFSDICTNPCGVKKLKTKASNKTVIEVDMSDSNGASGFFFAIVDKNDIVYIKPHMFGNQYWLKDVHDDMVSFFYSLSLDSNGTFSGYIKNKGAVCVSLGKSIQAELAVIPSDGRFLKKSSIKTSITFNIKEYLETRPDFYNYIKTLQKPNNLNAIIDNIIKERHDGELTGKEFKDILYQSCVLGATHSEGVIINKLIRTDED